MNNWSISKQDTNVLKALAIFAMLVHHLYGCPINDDIELYHGILFNIGNIGKVCVSIFLFLSGYGLSVQFKKYESSFLSIGRFTLKRYLKFYFNYWSIFLVFVPISVFIFGRTLSDAYGGSNIYFYLLKDILAVNAFKSYNITWWFNSLIIPLYLLFPFIYKFAQRLPLVTFIMSFILMLCTDLIDFDTIAFANFQFSFVLGILWDKGQNKLVSLLNYFNAHSIAFILFSVSTFLICLYFRQNMIIPNFFSVRIDGFLTCAIVLLNFSLLNKFTRLSLLLSFIGKHSMNIYMIHTFFNLYWHPEWLHNSWIMRHGLNFIVLLLVCLLISVVIEFLKNKFGLYRALEAISTKLSPKGNL